MRAANNAENGLTARSARRLEEKAKEKKISKRPRVFPIRNGGTFEVLPVLTEQEEAEKEVVAEREHKDAWKAKLNDLVRLLILNILY